MQLSDLLFVSFRHVAAHAEVARDGLARYAPGIGPLRAAVILGMDRSRARHRTRHAGRARRRCGARDRCRRDSGWAWRRVRRWRRGLRSGAPRAVRCRLWWLRRLCVPRTGAAAARTEQENCGRESCSLYPHHAPGRFTAFSKHNRAAGLNPALCLCASPRVASLRGPLLARCARAKVSCQDHRRLTDARAHAGGGDALH